MNSIDSEIEALKSIYEEELEIDHQEDPNQPVSLHVKVKPNEESGASSFVKVNFILPTNYPEVSPTISITNPRGISDGSCKTLMSDIENFVSERRGDNIIFDVLQLCVEFLVENQQTDESLCLICWDLLNLHPVTTTACDHYLHDHCFKRYVVYRQEDLIKELDKLPKVMQHTIELTLHCPVCREVLDNNLNLEIQKLPKRSPKKETTKHIFDFDWAKWREQRKKMNELFMRQKENGGIIDEDEEKKKNVLTAETFVEIPVAATNVAQADEAPSSSSSAVNNDTVPTKKHYYGRNNYRGRGQRPKYPRNN
ncbi:unnamed protein product [Auanema sp. JU1783]|nr:unnamed protein product [Auanema sp. JU1783]